MAQAEGTGDAGQARGVGIFVTARPEPPPGSVVLDREGDAWQRSHGNYFGHRWWHCGQQFTWTELLDKYGPVRVIYDPSAPAERES